MIDPNNPDAKALEKAVKDAADKLGPLTTAQLLEQQLQQLRRMAKSGDYPRVLYGKEGQTRIVVSKSEEKEAGSEWKQTPGDDHRKPAAAGAVVATEEAMAAELAVRRSNASLTLTDSRSVGAGLPEKITSDTTTTGQPAGNSGSSINAMTMPGVVPVPTPAATPVVPPAPTPAEVPKKGA